MAVVLLCSRCSNKLTVFQTVPHDWKADATSKGWQVSGNNWICPQHAVMATGQQSESPEIVEEVGRVLSRARSARNKLETSDITEYALKVELRDVHDQLIMLIARLNHLKRRTVPSGQ